MTASTAEVSPSAHESQSRTCPFPARRFVTRTSCPLRGARKRRTGRRTWKFKTGARIEGSAIVFDDAVVFGSGDGRIYAVDPGDGSEIWRLDLGEGLSASPAFAGGRIVIGGEDGTLFAIVGH